MGQETLHDTLTRRYVALAQQQFLGLWESMVDPAVEIISIVVEDLDLSIAALRRKYQDEGCEYIDSELETVGFVLDELSSASQGAEVAPGFKLVFAAYGPAHERKRMCIPLRIEGERP